MPRSVGVISSYDSLYDVLGVPESAGIAEIRAAYRRLARTYHPDRTGGGGAGDDSAMARLNEAYRVLGDPGRRADYDRSRRASAAAPRPFVAEPRTSAGAASRPAVPVAGTAGPARFPWKLVAGMGALGSFVVLVGAALYEPSAPPPPDQILQVGSCVIVIQSELAVAETPCDAAATFEVAAIVPMGDPCPVGADPYRDRLRGDTACVVERAPGS